MSKFKNDVGYSIELAEKQVNYTDTLVITLIINTIFQIIGVLLYIYFNTNI